VKPNRDLALTLLLVGVTVVWGWTFAVVKEAVSRYGVVSFLAIRFALAAVVMAPFAVRRATRRSWLTGAGIGSVLAVGYLFQTFGIRDTSATNSGLITGLFVVFAPLWNRAVFGVRLPWELWVAVAVSVLGLGLLTGAGPAPPRLGDLLTLGCAVSFGLHIALLDRYAKAHDAAALALAQLACSTVMFAGAWPATEPLHAPPETVWWALILTGVVATAGGFTAQTAAQRRLPGIRVALILTMEPVFAALFGWLLAGDRLTGTQWLGGALMVAALLVANVRQPQDAA
jgi:drug/metabolite transporter (DMT)-like permease